MRGAAILDKIFLTILNMSLTGAFAIIVICLSRVLLKKAPKIISYCLWAVAGFRLVFPFTIESMFSLIPFKAQTIPPDIVTQHIPRIDSGVVIVDNIISGVPHAAATQNSVYPLQIWISIGVCLWFLGLVVMLIYGVSSYLSVKRGIREAVCLEANLFEAENIQSPFILGILAPKIYIPSGLSVKERAYILLHEQTHLRRYDHIFKFAAYFILSLHWFNPLAWAAFLLMGVDMEMACDEYVMKKLGDEIKKDYSLSLLSLATDRRIISGSPLAFGENGVKKRIKNILMFKKPSRIVVTLAIAFVTVLCIGLVGSMAGTVDLHETPEIGIAISESADVFSVQPANQPPYKTLRDEEADLYEIPAVVTAISESANVFSEQQTNQSPAEPVNQTPNTTLNDEEAESLSIETDNEHDPVPDNKDQSNVNAEKIYIITDYYNANGRFSGRGLALNEKNSEKVLKVSGGDILIAGDKQYIVTAESLTLFFYTQPSFEQVMHWWVDYLDSWATSGKVAAVN
jgi:beta-lactamase regulating signal transducer with metallopeptidase domain